MYFEVGVLMQDTVKVVEPRGQAFIELFAEIIDALPKQAEHYAWYIVWLYGEGDMPHAVGCNMSDVLEAIDREGAFRIGWAQLKAMSRAMSQVFDLLIVGDSADTTQVAQFRENREFEHLKECHDIVVEAFDSYEWCIAGRDEPSVRAVAAALAHSR